MIPCWRKYPPVGRPDRPDRIYLFGSAARGDAAPDSDYDFMVVLPDDTPREIRDDGDILL